MKRLNVAVVCRATYTSYIDVQDDMTIEEAVVFAKNHINEIPILDCLEYISDTDTIDAQNCYFDETDLEGGE